MAEDGKEAFLSRWSRLKKDEAKPAEKVDESPAPQLPALDQLTPESDFTGFMHPKVKDALRRVALKKLFNDPHFNTPDPFEPFSGDWTVGEAISPELLATLNQSKTLLFSEEKKDDEPDAAPAPENPELAQAEPAPPDEPRKQDA
jgi:hypothetical protein